MRKSILAIGTALFAASLLPINPSLAQTIPQLHQGMPYSQARQFLLNAGWQRTFNGQQIDDSNPLSRVNHFLRLGYTEIVDCAGTGLGLCAFEFYGNQGQRLTISVGQGTQTDVVYGWQLDE